PVPVSVRPQQALQPLNLVQQGGDATCSLGLILVVLVQPNPLTVIGHQVQRGGHSVTAQAMSTARTGAVMAASLSSIRRGPFGAGVCRRGSLGSRRSLDYSDLRVVQ